MPNLVYLALRVVGFNVFIQTKLLKIQELSKKNEIKILL